MITEKPWGYEALIGRYEGFYLFKKIFLKKDKQTSLHYHNFKHETLLLISGRLKVEVEDKEVLMMPGDHIVLEPKVKHRMIALSDATYIESSTDHPDDVVRVSDDYGRV